MRLSARDSGYGDGDKNDGSADDDEESGQSTAEDEAQEIQVDDLEDTKLGLIYDKEAKQLFQVPIDSPEYEQAASPPENLTLSFENNIRDSPPITQTIIRADEFADSLSEDEWQYLQFRPIEELMDAITSADCTVYPTDAETNTSIDHASEIQLQFRPRSYVFIAETVELRFCKGKKSSTLSFCVDRISVTDTTQGFCVVQPCSVLGNAQCKHVTIDIQAINIDILPFQIELVSYHCMIPGLNDGSNKQSDTILMMSKCCHSSRRRHTVVDITGHRQKKCAYKHMIWGLVAEVTSAEEDSDAATERALSEAGNYDAPDVNHDPTEEDTISNSKLAVLFHHGGDDVVLTLLNNVMLHDVKSQIPAQVEWAVFVRFLQLSDKCSATLRDKAIKQAKTWVSNFHIPKTFDKDAVAWLWVMWKLQMVTEFKDLTALIQRQARNPVSRCLNELEDELRIELPTLLLDLLEQRRSEVLRRVKNRIASELNIYRNRYLENITERDILWLSTGEIMINSLSFGYLSLESERWMNHVGYESDYGIEFRGVSFLDVANGIRSTEDLGDWKVSTVSTADRMPQGLAMLTAFIPVLGVGLHQEGIHMRHEGFKLQLVGFITELEKENWGVDIEEIEG
ncbi:hypothetical protein T069G_00592 [Trichoderma breve]|uniref:Uncharacterized protein n=1 Tax=Trichoderma breve TaxID=2034170 RepID=A0A9W9JS44_9HYPO|nr:hypothetical protein T069G_00592 [Trichoderma breve]KAJ4864062.1 hypothetical protein T069G_00592 [Trichoderma breve]